VAYRFTAEIPEVQEGFALFIAAMYLVLAVFLAIYGWKLLYLVGVKNIRMPFLKSKLHISAITVTLFLVFTSRAIKAFLTAFNIGDIDISITLIPMAIQFLLICLMVLWEIGPSLMVLFLFWSIPDSRRNVVQKTVPVPYYTVIGSSPVSSSSVEVGSINTAETPYSNLFSNPDRYDSDESENHGNLVQVAAGEFANQAGYVGSTLGTPYSINSTTITNINSTNTSINSTNINDIYNPTTSTSFTSPSSRHGSQARFNNLRAYSTKSPLLGLDIPDQ